MLLKIGIYGYGKFGSFLAEKMADNGDFTIIVTDYNDNNMEYRKENISYLKEDEFLNDNFDIVVFANSINSFESVIKKIPPLFYKDTLIVDVLSVKEYPFHIFNKFLPENTEILLTHPMFGPNSFEKNNENIFVYYPINVIHFNRANSFLDFWRNMGCTLVSIPPEEHDIITSRTQFVTHFIGRVLNELHLEETGIDTNEFKNLFSITNSIIRNNSNDLFLGLARKNKNTKKIITDLKKALVKIESEINLEII